MDAVKICTNLFLNAVIIIIIIMIIKRNLCNEGYKGVSPRYKFTEKRQPFLVHTQVSFQEHETFSLYFSLKKHQRKLISLPLRPMGLKKSIAVGSLFNWYLLLIDENAQH